jgi:hypothetical protein
VGDLFPASVRHDQHWDRRGRSKVAGNRARQERRDAAAGPRTNYSELGALLDRHTSQLAGGVTPLKTKLCLGAGRQRRGGRIELCARLASSGAGGPGEYAWAVGMGQEQASVQAARKSGCLARCAPGLIGSVDAADDVSAHGPRASVRLHGASAWRDHKDRTRSVGEKFTRHAAQHRRAEASTAACTHDDEVGVLFGGDGGEAHRWPPDLDSPLSVRRTAAAARDDFQYALCPLGCRLSEPL